MRIRIAFLVREPCKSLVLSRDMGIHDLETYLRSSSASNFLGFFGQHSHMNPPWSFPGCMVSEDFRGVRIGLDS